MAKQETLELLLKAVYDNVGDDIYWWILKEFKNSLPEEVPMSLQEFLKAEIKKYDPNTEHKRKKKKDGRSNQEAG